MRGPAASSGFPREFDRWLNSDWPDSVECQGRERSVPAMRAIESKLLCTFLGPCTARSFGRVGTRKSHIYLEVSMADLLPDHPNLPIRDPQVAILILASAALYVGSMTIMKVWDTYPATLMAVGIAACLFGAIWFEILALRQARLSMVYVAMLGAEAIMLAAVARFGFGETLMPREIAGAALIVVGTFVATT